MCSTNSTTEHPIYDATVSKVGAYENCTVRLKGWLYNKRSSGKIIFIILRDGTGIIQCVASVNGIGQDEFEKLDKLNQESSLIVEGVVKKDPGPLVGMNWD